MTSWCHRHVGRRGARTLLEGPGESEREKDQPSHTPGVPGWAEEKELPQGLRTSKGEAGESGVLGQECSKEEGLIKVRDESKSD